MTIKTFFQFLFILTASAMLYAQDPDWHQVPKDDLSGNRGEIARILQHSASEEQCIQILQRTEADNDILYLKMLACKRLGKHGTKASVPALVALLDLEKQQDYARYALETIPGDEIDAALCESLKDLKNPVSMAGVLTSMGVRANPASASTAREYLTYDDAEVRKAAAYAFACCGGDDAVDFFIRKDIDPEQADSGFLLAEIFLAKGAKDKAIKIYDALAAADIRAYQKDSAVLWGILARGTDGIEMLVAQLNSDKPKLYAVGLKAGRELPAGAAVTKAMIEQLDKQDDSLRKAKLVRAIGDRKDKESVAASLPIITKFAESTDEAVRIAAIDSLKNIGDASVLSILIAAADQKDSEAVAASAKNVLAELSGKEVDDAIVTMLEKGDATTRKAAIGLIEQRRITTAFAQLRKCLTDSDAEVRKAALQALGQVATAGDMPVLMDALSNTTDPKDAEQILIALKSIGTRMPAEAATAEVAKRLDKASPPVKSALIELLKDIGGAKALEIVSGYAFGNDAIQKDKATAVLGQWSRTDDVNAVADVCLKLAKESAENKYKVRGLRGAVRIARQFDMSEERRLQICDEVLKLADRNDEKLLVIDVYWRQPSLKMLAEAMKHAGNDDFKEKSFDAAVRICEKLQGKSPEIVKAMQTVLDKSGDKGLKDRAKIVLDRQ